MKKPDRFERLVAKYKNIPLDDYDTHVIADYEAIKLIRREHAWMLRMVKELTVYRFPDGPFEDPYYISRQALLHKLAQRRK